MSPQPILNVLRVPSLEDIAMASLAIGIMEQEKIKRLYILHFSAKNPSNHLPSNEISIITSLCKSLNLPEILEKKFLCAVNWIIEQYCNWIDMILKILPWAKKFSKKEDFVIYIMESMYWHNGVVNGKRSMCQVLSFKNIEKNPIKMFQCASYYCLEAQTKYFWSEIFKDCREDILKEDGYDPKYYLMHYWACKINGKFDKFVEFISSYLKTKKYYEIENFSKEPTFYAFVLHIFEGTAAGAMHFIDELPVNKIKEQLILITEIYLRELEKRHEYRDAVVLYFLLNKIEDDVAVNRILNKFLGTFLKISLKYWPWHKFFETLVKLHSDRIDYVLFYDLMKQLVDDIQKEKTDVFLVKKLWKHTPSDVKKSFCVFISKSQKGRNVKGLWKTVTIEVIDMFLRDEELRNVLTPYDNIAVFELIVSERYDVLDYWLKKCLVSKEAIISFMENLIQTKAFQITNDLQRHPLNLLNKFLEWAFQFEKLMNEDVNFRVKNQIIEGISVSAFVKGMTLKKWEDLQIFIDWIIKNKYDYEDTLLAFKKTALEEFFLLRPLNLWSHYDFEKCFFTFLQYGITKEDKLKIMINEICLNKEKICAELLKKGDWESVHIFFKALSTYDIDILEIKRNVFLYIFIDKEADFEDKDYCEGIKKLLCWNLKQDLNMKSKVWKIKKFVIENHATKSIINCIKNDLSNALNNILNCFFEDEGENFEKAISDLKINVIENAMMDDFFWQRRNRFLMLVQFINWGKENPKIKDIWDVKKHFIECFKNNLREKIILELVLCKENNFIYFLFEDNESESDFKEMLWDTKDFLLMKLLDNNIFLFKIFDKFDEFNQFLNWKGFNEAKVQNYKKLIFDEKGVDCCLYWISGNNFHEINHFLEWCIKNDNMKSEMSNLKRKVTEKVVSEYSKNWRKRNYFQQLNKFLLLHSEDFPNDLKRDLFKKHGVKSCGECLAKGIFTDLKYFLIWAEVNTEESATTFKKELLEEILDIKCIECWGEHSNFYSTLDKFLYLYYSPDCSKISSMKLDVVEVHFCTVFTKLLSERKFNHVKNFFAWTFDKHMKTDEFKFRINKFMVEIFKKFGNKYCALMLENNDWQAAANFWSLRFNYDTNVGTVNLSLWDFKKECIKQMMKERAVRKRNNGGGLPEVSMEKIKTGLKKFLFWNPAPINEEKKITHFIRMMKQKYGVDI